MDIWSLHLSHRGAELQCYDQPQQHRTRLWPLPGAWAAPSQSTLRRREGPARVFTRAIQDAKEWRRDVMTHTLG